MKKVNTTGKKAGKFLSILLALALVWLTFKGDSCGPPQWTEVSSASQLKAAISSKTNYIKLTGNIKMNNQVKDRIRINYGPLYLDLAKYHIEGDDCVFQVDTNGTFQIMASGDGAYIESKTSTTQTIFVNGGDVSVISGYIFNISSKNAVYMSGGLFTLMGTGYVSRLEMGSGVFQFDSGVTGEIVVAGGTCNIIYGTAGDRTKVSGTGKITMSGGTADHVIVGNPKGGIFIMEGGTVGFVSVNEPTNKQLDDAVFVMKGGEVTGKGIYNSGCMPAASDRLKSSAYAKGAYCGALHIDNLGTVLLSGGQIRGYNRLPVSSHNGLLILNGGTVRSCGVKYHQFEHYSIATLDLDQMGILTTPKGGSIDGKIQRYIKTVDNEWETFKFLFGFLSPGSLYGTFITKAVLGQGVNKVLAHIAGKAAEKVMDKTVGVSADKLANAAFDWYQSKRLTEFLTKYEPGMCP